MASYTHRRQIPHCGRIAYTATENEMNIWVNLIRRLAG